jgi:hypothetical protein
MRHTYPHHRRRLPETIGESPRGRQSVQAPISFRPALARRGRSAIAHRPAAIAMTATGPLVRIANPRIHIAAEPGWVAAVNCRRRVWHSLFRRHSLDGQPS